MNNIILKGVYSALITPLNADSTVNVNAIEKTMKWQMERGLKGFYVLGATGEGPVLAYKERVKMAEASLDIGKKLGAQMTIHIGAADSMEAIALAKHAAQNGADAISSVCPNFYFTYTLDEIADYYKAIADASGLPVLAYCTTLLGNIDVVQFMEKIMSVDGVAGCKYTLPNYYNMQRIKLLNGGNINVINGPDEMLICGLSMGADGGIGSTYNIMPRQFSNLYNKFVSGDIRAAIDQQSAINRVITVLIKHGVIASVKLALKALGMDVGNQTFPTKPYSLEKQKIILSDLEKAGLFEMNA